MLEEDLIKKLNEMKELAFKETTPNISVLKAIKGELFTVNKKNREFLRPFVDDLNDKLFQNNTSIQGLDLETYLQNGKEQSVEISKEKTVEVKIEEKDVEITFDELLKKLLICIQDTLTDLKGYAIIKLSNQAYKNIK